MKLRKCRKCKTLPILKSETVYVQEPTRLNESLKIPEPKLSYYYECECKSIVISNTISNGCGATRVAYGSAVILRTVSALLTFIKEIESGAKEENCLINIAPDKVVYDFDTFEEKRCRCCGDKTQ